MEVITPRQIENEIIGSLLVDPILMVSDIGMSILPTDFQQDTSKQIHSAMSTLFASNLVVNEKEIIKFLQTIPNVDTDFLQEYIFTAKNIAEPKNFNYNVDLLKKYGLLRDLATFCDISSWYTTAPVSFEIKKEMEEKLVKCTISDILENIFGRVVALSDPYVQTSETMVQDASSGIDALLDSLEEAPDYGVPLFDAVFTTITKGCRKTKVYCVSGGTGAGKTRMAIAQAVNMSIPISWDIMNRKWIYSGADEKVGVCSTELQVDEMQTIILATISGVDEDHILECTMTDEEKKRVRTAAAILKKYEGNLTLWRMPDPNIKQIVSGVRRMKLTHQLDALFFDYIHTSPNLIQEYAGQIREDVALLLIVNALKNLANELNLFIWTGTQYNAHGMTDEFVTENCLRGSRSIADKLDFGAGLRVPTKEELAKIQPIIASTSMMPNMFLDVYKNRRSRFKSVRVWMQADLGRMRYKVLYVTDWKHNLVECNSTHMDLGMEEKYGRLDLC